MVCDSYNNSVDWLVLVQKLITMSMQLRYEVKGNKMIILTELAIHHRDYYEIKEIKRNTQYSITVHYIGRLIINFHSGDTRNRPIGWHLENHDSNNY